METLNARLKKDIPEFNLKKGDEVTVQHWIAGGDNLTLQTGLWKIIDNQTPNWSACAKDKDLIFLDQKND